MGDAEDDRGDGHDWLPTTFYAKVAERKKVRKQEERIRAQEREQARQRRQSLAAILVTVLCGFPAIYVVTKTQTWAQAKARFQKKKRRRTKGPKARGPAKEAAGGGAAPDEEESDEEGAGAAAPRDAGRTPGFPAARRSVEEILDDGRKITRVGRMVVGPGQLGLGSAGTIVFEGVLDGRKVAVKRILRQFYELAQKEINALIASDEHPNVVRCFAMEEDGEFLYLALERCDSSLADYLLQRGTRGKMVDKATRAPTPHCFEIMADIVGGLRSLHGIGLVHRDLKPQNVLLSMKLRAKVSDMGLSKQLGAEQSSFEGTGLGSAGWQSPEVLFRSGQRLTRAVDVFSLGCVLFYCMTAGGHPFGKHYERDGNISRGKWDLSAIKHLPLAVDLVQKMIEADPKKRPTSTAVAAHPFWWGPEKCLGFLVDVSNFMENHDRMPGGGLLPQFESYAAEAFGKDWRPPLDRRLLEDLTKFRRYDFGGLRDLLRIIRNKASHFRELSPDVMQLLSPYPVGFARYFLDRYPRLLLAAYKFAAIFLGREPAFAKYFPEGAAVMHKFALKGVPQIVLRTLKDVDGLYEFDATKMSFAGAEANHRWGGHGGGGERRHSLGDASRPRGAGAGPRCPHPRRPGLEICAHFVKTGYCRYGDTCPKDHPPEHWAEKNAAGLPLRPGRDACEYYLRTGKCKYGPTCKNHHPEREQRRGSTSRRGSLNDGQGGQGVQRSAEGFEVVADPTAAKETAEKPPAAAPAAAPAGPTEGGKNGKRGGGEPPPKPAGGGNWAGLLKPDDGEAASSTRGEGG